MRNCPIFSLSPKSCRYRSQRWALRLLALFGWHVHFAPLPGPRGVVIVYPHTSNWDFPIGILAKSGVGVPIRWLGKEAYLKAHAGYCWAVCSAVWVASR